MSRQRGQVGIILGVIIVILVLALIGLFAVCTPGENDHGDSLGWVQLAYHDGGGECWDEYDCRGRDYGDDGNGDYGGNRYRNENGTRNDQRRCQGRGCRGSFSPGPFDRSPVNIIVCPPGTQYCGAPPPSDNGGEG